MLMQVRVQFQDLLEVVRLGGRIVDLASGHAGAGEGNSGSSHPKTLRHRMAEALGSFTTEGDLLLGLAVLGVEVIEGVRHQPPPLWSICSR